MTETLDNRLDILNQLFNSANHAASLAMSRWTNGQITLALDDVVDMDLEAITNELNMADDMSTMVILTIGGDMAGELVLSYDDQNARRMAAALLNREPTTEGELTSLEASALKETGNILGCAYLRSLAESIQTELVPSPPFFVQDFGASVIGQAIASQAIESDRALICRTRYRRHGDELNWDVYFVPNPTLLAALENAI